MIYLLTSIDWYVLRSCIKRNVEKSVHNAIRTHEKKLKSLTRNTVVPFTHEEVIQNLSSTKLSPDELDILKNGLDYAIPPERLRKSDIYTSFEMIHRFMTSKIKSNDKRGELKTEISHLASCYL